MKKFVLVFFIFILSVLLLLSSGVVDSQDGFQYLVVARNIYYTGKPTAPIYEYDKRLNIHMSTYGGKDGNTYSPTGLGYSLALVPAVAITDLVYKYFNVNPPIHFPLENDWLILMLASFTNPIFGAILGVTLFIFFKKLKISTKDALFLSLISIFTTNLLVYTKHTWAHIMFTVFLVLTALFLKLFSIRKERSQLIFAGIAFGIMSITYNQTFILTVPALLIYYFLLNKPRINLIGLRGIIIDIVYFTIGFLPFFVIYSWFEQTRQAATGQNQASITFLSSYANHRLFSFPISVFLEGIFGQLLSPGRSFFIYSPLLITPIIFGHKIRKSIRPELLLFIILTFTYVIFFATQRSVGGPEQGITALWHGESSWGPRYLIPIIPFGMLIVGSIYQNLTKKAKLFVFYPLVATGFYISLLGILMPYQIKFHELQDKFYINSTEYTNYSYSNLLPRYSPVFMISKKLIKLFQTLPKTLNHGRYNVRFYDGIDFTFPVGPERWRVIDRRGYISFDNLDQNPTKKLTFGLINHPVAESSSSAYIDLVLNDHKLLENPLVLKISERQLVDVPIKGEFLKKKNNQLIIDVNFSSKISEDKQFIVPENRNLMPPPNYKQILGIISFSINNQEVNTESIDFPYISSLGPAMMGINYNNYGGKDFDPWKSWHIHTQVYERVPDFWWVKSWYYWDIPKKFYMALLIMNITAILYFGKSVYVFIKKYK